MTLGQIIHKIFDRHPCGQPDCECSVEDGDVEQSVQVAQSEVRVHVRKVTEASRELKDTMHQLLERLES